MPDETESPNRGRALAEGTLIDVTPEARRAGFVCPVAVSRGVWLDCVERPPGKEGPAERLADLLEQMAGVMERKAQFQRVKTSYSTLRFAVGVANAVRDEEHDNVLGFRTSEELLYFSRTVYLRAFCVPDDDGKPCITVLHDEKQSL